jgi:hypothetical protein
MTVSPDSTKYFGYFREFQDKTGEYMLEPFLYGAGAWIIYVDRDVTLNGTTEQNDKFNNVKLIKGWNYILASGTNVTATNKYPGPDDAQFWYAYPTNKWWED